MEFIHCRDCKLPFERRVCWCPNCGALFPGLTSAAVHRRRKSLVVPAAIGAILGGSIGFVMLPGTHSISASVGWLTALAGLIVGQTLGQRLLSSMPGPNPSRGLVSKQWPPVMGAALGYLVVPFPMMPDVVTIAAWACAAGVVAALPGLLWWSSLEHSSQRCWRRTRHRHVASWNNLFQRTREVSWTEDAVRTDANPLTASERIAILEQRESELFAQIHSDIAGIWQTELLQWHTQLFYRLHSPAPTDIDGCKALMEALDELRTSGEAHLRQWRQRRFAARSPEGKTCIERLEQLLTVIERFRQCVLDHQVVLVTRETETRVEVQHLANDLRAVDASIIRGERWDPWDTAAKIEAETARLDARKELDEGASAHSAIARRSAA